MTFLAITVLASWPLSADDGGWIAGGTSGQWEWGIPTTGPGGPARMWATNLDGFALNDASDFVEIPIPSLAGASYPVLVLDHWYRMGPGDHGIVEVDPGTGWQPLTPAYGAVPFEGDSGGFVQDAFPLAGHGANPRVRLLFESDAALSAEGWYVASAALYDGDAIPPHVAVTLAPADTTDLAGPYPVVVEARDDLALTSVRLFVSIDDGPEVASDMAPDGPDRFRGEIGPRPPGTLVTWHVEAADAEQVTRTDDAAFRVYLPAPQGLSGPAGRAIGTHLDLQWQPPDATHPVVGYEVLDDQGTRTESELPFVTVPVGTSGAHSWTVRARYTVAAGQFYGDPSQPLFLDVEVPVLHALVPDAAGPGDRLWVAVSGQSLYLEQAVVDVDLGEGIFVEDVDVLDAENALVRVRVGELALPGERDVEITGAQGSFRFHRAFDVLDDPIAGGEAVATPSVLFQGRPTEVTFTAPVPFAGPVDLDPGPDLVVLDQVVVDLEKVHVELLAPIGTPPGTRTLVLDDGQRIFTADLVVRASITDVPGTCGGVHAPGLAGLALALAAIRRRR